MLAFVAVQAPGFGDRRKDMREEISALTGGEVVTKELGVALENIDIDKTGTARHIVVNKDNTTIVGGAGVIPRSGSRHAIRIRPGK